MVSRPRGLDPRVHNSHVPVHRTRADLIRDISGIIADRKVVKISDETQVRRSMDILAFNAVDFGQGRSAAPEVMTLSRYLIAESGRQLGVVPASVFPFYAAMAQGMIGRPMTVPAINIRGDSYNTARSLFRAASDNRVAAVILEIARSEMSYTNQAPAEYAAIMTAAAVREGFRGRLFLQGDHFQINAANYRKNPDLELRTLKDLIRESIAAGFGQIDLDASTLERRGEEGIAVEEAVRENAELTASLTEFVRYLEGHHETPYVISLGGESGEVGRTNTTVEEYRSFMAVFRRELAQAGIDKGISKISVNTGTAHGGIRLPDGTLADVKIGFDTLKEISLEARKDGLAGAVQHGASTLPDEVFHRFVEYETAEVHLATAFQDIAMENMPKDLIEALSDWIRTNCVHERKAEQTDIQFLLACRKKSWGPNKEKIWRMEEEPRQRAADKLEAKFAFLFQQLNVTDTEDLVQRYVPEPAMTFQHP